MRFNTQTTGTKTTNLAGGEAYTQNPKLEFVSILLTSFVQDQYYRSAGDTINRVRQLISLVPAEFAAKAAIYARREFGMRSISHVVAGEICKQVTGESWVKDFLNKVIFRPDDITEITSYFFNTGGDKETNAMRKGFGAALSRFDAYQLAKYRAEGAKISLVDCVNLYHPKHTDAIKKLVEGKLRNKETWEAKLTEAGKQAETKEEKEALKAKAWGDLLREKKLGYFALLRNLRNILQQAPELVDIACEQLVDEKSIRKSLVLPFRYATAMDELEKVTSNRKIMQAISDAMDISVTNCPVLSGRTLIAVDDSGSMYGRTIEIATLFGSVLYKSNDSDLCMFSHRHSWVNLNPRDSVLGMQKRLMQNVNGGGTDFDLPFDNAKEKYDRVVVLSDMQGWAGRGAGQSALTSYEKRTGAHPHVYSFDLSGYGTLQFPQPQIYCIAGFSEKIFDVMKLLEQDRNALVKKIEEVNFLLQ